MSHVYSNIVSSAISYFNSEYENIAKITITCGNIHKYFRMIIDYFFPVKVKFSMVDYIGRMLYDILEDIIR